MQEVVRISRPIQIDESDLISIDEAAQMSKRAMSVISNMIDRGTLPWYQLRAVGDTVPGERVQRFTSRKSVMALPKPSKK